MPTPRDGTGALTPVGSSDDEAEPGVTAINPVGLPEKELRKLKDRFQDANGQQIKLTLDQFVKALSPNQPHSESPAQSEQWRSELETLFKKIDASCTETVNWEEFTNYMLLHMPGFNGGDGACELSHNPQSCDALAGAWGSGHTDMINCVTVIPDVGVGSSNGGTAAGASGGGLRRYVTTGRDGFVKVWFPNLTLQKAIDVGQRRSWLSASCWMPKSRHLAVASSSFKIYFYDATFSPTPVAHIAHNEGTPLCLGYTEPSYESDGRVKEILMVGDNNGYVTVYPMDDDWMEQESKSDSEPLRFKSKPSRQLYHTDWVTKVGFVSEMQAMVTCGLDGEINLCDLHMNRRKEGRDAIRLHKKGVHTWCWCKSYKWFASGGLDRQIIVWNPYTQRAITSLQGHNAPVLDVLVNETQHQLISMSVDKVVKVWDIRNYKCIQTFTDKTEYKPEDRLTCMGFDEDGPALVMCSSTINVLPVSVKVETSRTHLAPIVGALYNDVFHQVVSGDSSGTICVWDVRTGKLEFEFRRAHQDHKLTCMAFDESKRRLYTGAEDGVVKLWNFSSGQQLRSYTMRQPSEITGLLWAREGPNTFVVGLAWDRRIYVWPDRSRASIEAQYVLEDSTGQGHTGDISCIERHSSINGLLATGGEDGYVVFWKIQETSSASASARRYRLCDKMESTQEQDEQKRGGLEPKLPRGRKKPGPGGKFLSSLASDAEPLSGGTGPVSGANTLQPGTGKGAHRASLVPVSPGSRVFEDGAAAPRSSESPTLGITRDCGDGLQRNASEWPEELGFAEEHVGIAAGVEKMIHLEHKFCLLTTHTDGRVRLWSTKSPDFLQRLELLAPAPPASSEVPERSDIPEASDKLLSPASAIGMAEPTASTAPAAASAVSYVAAQTAPVTALYSDNAENRWLFTGDADGYVRTWDLAPVRPALKQWPRYLLLLQEFQPHQQAVTQLQHFELDGHVVVMSASADWTIALCSIEGERIGTFSGRGPHWNLAEKRWRSEPPPLDEGPRASEDEDGWGLSPRRAGKGPQGRHAGRANAGAGGGAGVASTGVRTPRTGLNTRPTVMPQALCRPQHLQLNADKFRPDMSLVEHERQWLAKQSHRSEQ